VKHVAVFKNHGVDAGASLSHTHSQLITTPFLPTTLEEELEASKQYWNKNSRCQFCDIIQKEKSGPRFIWENQSFVVFAPYASINPLEFWLFPKRHESNMVNMSEDEVRDLAETLRVCLGALKSLMDDQPYNFGFHTLLQNDAQDCYHWHLEVYPKVLTWAGFEKSTGMYINMISPEDAAAELRTAVEAELKTL
jgi:UDPglucose--hexose-1-phosphate uridylyltransferase